MLVTCPVCTHKATIRSSEAISDTVRNLYCQCKNIKCSHTFAVVLSFSHTISPSALKLSKKIRDELPHKSLSEQKVLLNMLDD